ncbi:MAG: flagellar assembly protein A, partial [Candidatus Latescibacterota bacterium]
MDEERAHNEGTRGKPDSPEGGASDLLGGLEDLLQEEGFQAEEEGEEGLADLLDDTDGSGSSSEPAPTGPSPQPRGSQAAPRQRLDLRAVRASRRTRDRDDFRSLDSHMRVHPMGLEVAADRLCATVTRLTADNTPEEVLDLLAANGIVSGIDHEAIRTALVRAARGHPVLGVVVAHGRPPRVLEPARLVYHLPPALTASGPAGTELERLKGLLEGDHPEALHSFQGQVQVVRRGDLLVEVAPARVEPGEDVMGQPLDAVDTGDVALECGDNTGLWDDGTRCTAAIYGFAGLVQGLPTVLPPIWVSHDHMEARFVYLRSTEAAPAPSLEDLQQLLQDLWIDHGVLDKQVALVQKRLERGLTLAPTVLIARGTPEVPGQDAQVQYAFDRHAALLWTQVQGLWSLPSAESLERALAEVWADPDAPRLRAFRPGQVLQFKVPATEGLPGKDIQGEEIIPREGQDIRLEAGVNLCLSEDGLQVLAECFGYACLVRDNQICLLPPIWIAPDRMTAYYANLPQAGTPVFPSPEEVQEMLALLQVEHGFDAHLWNQHLAELAAGLSPGYLIPVAQGTPAVPGRDAALQWAIEVSDRSPGTVQDDGSINFRERNLTTVVKEGDLIGRLVPPRPGAPGRNVLGTPVLSPTPLNIEVVTDARIRAEKAADGSISFYAEVSGGVSREAKFREASRRTQQRIHIGIYPISNIENDVDYSTGNIDFNGDVLIGGSVQPQFSVRATGSVTIGAYVEAGAYITAGTDILVKRGVVGASTELVAGRDVMAKYIQEATVRAGRDVRAGSYIFNASIRAGGQVVVAGKGEGKSRALVGGLIWGARGIAARSVGSPYNTNTRLVAGIDPEYVNRADQIRANMQACEERQRRLMKSIGVESLDVELIRQRLGRCRTPEEKQAMLACIKRIARVAELQENLQKELGQI